MFNKAIPGKLNNWRVEDIAARKSALARTQKRMGNLFKANQLLGRKGSIGCVSLEISQRCNLDCSLCYLSPNSNDVVDLPLEEIFRRLDEIKKHYGIGANVQISGGDPTLRNRNELVKIVGYARGLGLHPALFTNGILATRELLKDLSANGLSDVAFHVDTTQGRKGYHTEEDLNAVRLEYLDRARGLPLMVVFNTTVHDGNYLEIPSLVDFFVKNAGRVGMASFQLQADTGRGILGKSSSVISLENMKEKINKGAGNLLGWDAFIIGHPKCHSYAPTIVINGKAHSLVDDSDLVGRFLQDFTDVTHDRREVPGAIAKRYLLAALAQPRWLFRGLKYFIPRLWKIRKDIMQDRKMPRKISFFIQNFMDAKSLNPERIQACSFMVMTSEGPMSMCAHNASRDEFILKSLSVEKNGSHTTFYPLEKKTPAIVAECGC